MREIRIALLEADVSLPVVKEFIAKVKEQSVGEKGCPFDSARADGGQNCP